jgi:hypothetical protein
MQSTLFSASRSSWLLAISLVLAACGGGGGGVAAVGPTPPTGGDPGLPFEPPPALRSWQGAESLEELSGKAQDIHVATDAVGNGIAVWTQPKFEGQPTDVWYRRYSITTGWDEPHLLEDGDEPADSARVAMSPDGHAMVVWRQLSLPAFESNIWARRIEADGAISVAETIDHLPRSASEPEVAMDGLGRAIVVWRHFTGPRIGIFANHHSGVQWGAQAVLVEEGQGSVTSQPQIAMNAAGDAVVAWQQAANATPGTRTDIWANRFAQETNEWGTAGPAESDDAGPAELPRVALSASGEAVVVWNQTVDNGATKITSVWANLQTAQSDWGTSAPIETSDAGSAGAPRVAMDAAGNAVAMWIQALGTDPTARTEVWTARRDATKPWGEGGALNPVGAIGSALAVDVAMAPDGRAVVTWTESDVAPFTPDEVHRVHARQYQPDAGWADADRLEEFDEGGSDAPSVAMSPNGAGLTAWLRYDATFQKADAFANVLR